MPAVQAVAGLANARIGWLIAARWVVGNTASAGASGAAWSVETTHR